MTHDDDIKPALTAEESDEATAETFRTLGERHVIRAAKIAALLPPV